MANVHTRKHEYSRVLSHIDYKNPEGGLPIRPSRSYLTDIVTIEVNSLDDIEAHDLEVKESQELRRNALMKRLEKAQKTNWTCGEPALGRRGTVPDIQYDTRSAYRHAYADPHETPHLVLYGDISCRPDVTPASGIVPAVAVSKYGQIPSWYPEDYLEADLHQKKSKLVCGHI